MGYLHIENLYKDQTILMFRECYALEKIHGTSAHVQFTDGVLRKFSGGASHEAFSAIFKDMPLLENVAALGHASLTIYGEAYGGSMQRMRETYGDRLRFVAFDVKVGDAWLNVPDAADVCAKVGLEFVDYARVSTDLSALDAERDRDSIQAARNGCGPGKMREGVILRPLVEMFKKTGDRVIAKHKRADFRETATPRDVDPEKQKVLEAADAIAMEWVTDMRLEHVLDKVFVGGAAREMNRTQDVVRAMTEDVLREAAGEIVDSKDARRAIGMRTAKMFKALVMRAPSGVP